MANEITLKDIIEAIIRSCWMLVSFFLIAIIIAFFFYFTTPKSYTAEATIMPVAGSDSGIASFLAGTGLGMLSHAETKANVILVALNSHSLAKNVLKKHNLAGLLLDREKEKLSPAEIDKAAHILPQNIMSFFVTKNGTIMIRASFKDQDKVADLANYYVEELSVFLNFKSINMNFIVIDKAQRPLKPSAPSLMKNMIISLGIAFFFGLTFILFNLAYYKK
ncbi:hypothetical protein KKF32_05235 [Patescibacteria group bacterium]|nr:hypothetical protein [Patescibacteria group bacterium]